MRDGGQQTAVNGRQGQATGCRRQADSAPRGLAFDQPPALYGPEFPHGASRRGLGEGELGVVGRRGGRKGSEGRAGRQALEAATACRMPVFRGTFVSRRIGSPSDGAICETFPSSAAWIP